MWAVNVALIVVPPRAGGPPPWLRGFLNHLALVWGWDLSFAPLPADLCPCCACVGVSPRVLRSSQGRGHVPGVCMAHALCPVPPSLGRGVVWEPLLPNTSPPPPFFFVSRVLSPGFPALVFPPFRPVPGAGPRGSFAESLDASLLCMLYRWSWVGLRALRALLSFFSLGLRPCHLVVSLCAFRCHPPVCHLSILGRLSCPAPTPSPLSPFVVLCGCCV